MKVVAAIVVTSGLEIPDVATTNWECSVIMRALINPTYLPVPDGLLRCLRRMLAGDCKSFMNHWDHEL